MKTLLEHLRAGTLTNAMAVYAAARSQAEEEIGRNIASWFIGERRAGRPFSNEESAMYIRIQSEAYKARTFQIINDCYSALPSGMVGCVMMREYLTCVRTSL